MPGYPDKTSSQTWELPPLVLHPFSNGLDAANVLESMKLALHSAGLLELCAQEESRRVVLQGKYSEFRMLCFVGKDLVRWIRQCADFTSRDALLAHAGIREQSFSDLLVNYTPLPVAGRFAAWGVGDYRHILSRAIGLNAIFPAPPEFGVLSNDFLENYYSYADSLFTCYQGLFPFTRLDPDHFRFSLYTSDEYLSTVTGIEDLQSPQPPESI
jgi:hypothetical protein